MTEHSTPPFLTTHDNMGLAPSTWNDDYQAEALKLAAGIRNRRHMIFSPAFRKQLLLADALAHAISSSSAASESRPPCPRCSFPYEPGAAERYWEARWRDADAELQRLSAATTSKGDCDVADWIERERDKARETGAAMDLRCVVQNVDRIVHALRRVPADPKGQPSAECEQCRIYCERMCEANDEVVKANATIELLERNAGIQAKLLADTHKTKEAFREYIESSASAGCATAKHLLDRVG